MSTRKIDKVINEEIINQDLSDFFKLLSQEKRRKKEEIDFIIGDLQLESVFSEVSNIKKKTKKKKKTSAKLNVIEEEIIPQQNELIEKSLGLLSEPSNIKQQTDSLTPLDQKFATLDDLQKHYTLFLSRIQQQLSTVGGGGETNLAYMDMPLAYVTSSSYFVKHQDYYIGVNYEGKVTITLPTPRKNGKVYIIKDELGQASRGANRHITILPSGSDLIDGQDKAILAYDFGSLTFVYRNGWRVV